MISENLLIPDDNNFSQITESQTLDSLLQNAVETTTHSECNPSNGSIFDANQLNNIESCPKRSWKESVELYVSSLKPKDTIIFIENVKVFSKGTVYMSDLKSTFFDLILKYLNGGDPLKSDFGRDEYTSLYSLYSFSVMNSESKVECSDTPMIFKIMETMDTLDFTDRNLIRKSIKIRKILENIKDIFQSFDKIRNNHPKRKRYFIFISCSDLLIDGIEDLVEDLRKMKVRFSLFSPVRHKLHSKLCDLLNYNNKGCKDLSGYYHSTKWPVTLSHGLYKAFESINSYQHQNKKVKWKEVSESNENDFINMMGLGNISNGSQVSEILSNHVPVDIENSLNNSLVGRSMTTTDQIEQNFGQTNNNNNISLTSSQSLTHTKSQPKFLTSSNAVYYPSNSINQSQINKVNQVPYYFNQDQLYSAPNSVSVSSHRSTPSSIPHSQSPQFHMGNAHQNLLQQSNSVPEIVKPNSVESCNEIHNQLNPQLSSQKSIQMNQESEMVQSLQRFPFANNIYGTSNNLINTNNMNSNRFVSRPQLYQSSMDPRIGSTNLFDGILIINDEYRTEIRLFVDQMTNLSLFSMESWERQCLLNYVTYYESYNISLNGKTNTDMDLVDNSYKSPVDLQIKMNQQVIETIFNTLASKPNASIGIVRPSRQISADVHVQLICFILNRSTNTLKVLIPADPKSLLNEIKNRMPHMYPGPQAGQIYSQMKRNNIVPNQQMYNISQPMPMPRQILNRYNSHTSAPISMINNQVYRSISHPSNFINTQQMQTTPGYILHSNQYSQVQNQSSSHLISMDIGMQSNQNIYEQNSY